MKSSVFAKTNVIKFLIKSEFIVYIYVYRIAFLYLIFIMNLNDESF